MKRCLVIDDSSVVRKVACHLLEKVGCTTSEAESAADGIGLCGVLMPDIIFIDWDLPECNVLEAIAAIRGVDSDRRPYIVYMTTEHDSLDIARALSAGADDYLLKPFDRLMLETKLEEISNSLAA